MIVVFILTGCIGENYDFSPPAINLSSDSNIKSEELAEANIDWRGVGNNPIEKEIKKFQEATEELHGRCIASQ